jgi:hypothetical protein
MLWRNEYGDLVDQDAREAFIEDEIVNDANAGGDAATARAYALRVFDRLHVEVK